MRLFATIPLTERILVEICMRDLVEVYMLTEWIVLLQNAGCASSALARVRASRF